MKKIIVVLAVVLVVSGLGSLAYAQDPVNEVQAEFITAWAYRTSGDTFTNHEVTGTKHWFTNLNNQEDGTGAPVNSANLTLESDLTFDSGWEEAELTAMGPPTYEWSFGDVGEGDGVNAGVNFRSPNPCNTVTFTPGFDASRSADITEFLYSDGMQVQTLSVTLTTEQWMEELGATVSAEEQDLVDSVITDATTDGPNIYMDIDPDRACIRIHDLEAGTYNFTFLIEVTPKVPKVEFMPEVLVEQEATLFEDSDGGYSVSRAVDPDDADIGTWTWSAEPWSAEDSYEWERKELRQMGVVFRKYSREIMLQHEPMTGQKLVGSGLLGTQPLDDGTYDYHETLSSFTNPNCVSEITIERISIFRMDGAVIYEGPLLTRGGELWTEPMKPHETRLLSVHWYMPGEAECLLPIAPYTVEIFWSGSDNKGLPLTGWQSTAHGRLDDAGYLIGLLQPGSASQMANMEPVLIPKESKEKK